MVEETPVLKCALYYADKLGWCIIPVPYGRKEARIRWRRLQAERPDRAQLRRWLARGQHNIAVITGAVSGGLACRDFDVLEVYLSWAKAHPDLAKSLPTVKTARGYQVYYLSDTEELRDLGDGELRAGRCYCMLPPSVHPDGPKYEWIIRPTKSNLVVLEPELAGFVPHVDFVTEKPEQTEPPEPTEQTEAMVWGREVEEAIRETLPREFGTRNRRVFELTRTLKSLPQFAGAEARDLRPIVQEWHRRALPKIRTKAFEETWIDFLKAWPRVRYPTGYEPIAQIFRKAVESERPQIGVTKYPDNDKLQILVSFCRELQQAAGEQPFFLATRTAGRLLAVSHAEASRWFFLLETDQILRVVAKGGTHENPRNATRFRYLGD